MKCLDGLNAIKLDVSGDKYYVFSEVVEKAYDNIEKKIQGLKDEIKEKEIECAHLEAELEILSRLHNLWKESWDEEELGDLKGKISINNILAFISSKFTSVEKKKEISFKSCGDVTEDKRRSLKRLESRLKNLFLYYSLIEKKEVQVF